MPLYSYFGKMLGLTPRALPRLTINLFSGGAHAGRQIAIQDVLIVPARCATIDESLALTYDVYQSAAAVILKRYSMRLLTADEGGLSPPCQSVEELIETALTAIKAAGYRPGSDVVLALDVAASHFYSHGRYILDGSTLDSAAMIDKLSGWVKRYPIVSVEDGLAEDDWEWWPALRQSIEGRALVLGDDLLCTNPPRIRRAVDSGACPAAQTQPGRHSDGGRGSLPDGKRCGMASDRQCAQRRDGGQLDRRPGRGVERRSVQSWLDHAVRAPGEVQPAAGD